MELQKAASKRRRKVKTGKFIKAIKGSKHSRAVDEFIGKMIGQGHAMGGRKAMQGNPMYNPPHRGKFKGYMRTA
jgi:hypothetical protein